MKTTTWLADFAVKVSVTFEKFNPALFRLLATLLPYSTPLPVAWYTSKSAQTFLNFTPGIAGVFVFGLEGMGILFTSLFVDAVIDWIRSRNSKTFALVAMFGFVVAVYVFLLVRLNVTLEQINNPGEDQALSQVITLMCFIPLLSGIGNGYNKWKLEANTKADEVLEYERSKEERDAERRIQVQLEKFRIKHGASNPQTQNVYPSETKVVSKKKSDWRQLTQQEQYEAKHVLTPKELLEKYDIGRATAYAWRTDRYKVGQSKLDKS